MDKNEQLKGGEQSQEPTEAEKVLSSMPDFNEHAVEHYLSSLRESINALDDENDKNLAISLISAVGAESAQKSLASSIKNGIIQRDELIGGTINARYMIASYGNAMQTDINNGKNEIQLECNQSNYIFDSIPENCNDETRKNMAALRTYARQQQDLIKEGSDSERLVADHIKIAQDVNNNYDGNIAKYIKNQERSQDHDSRIIDVIEGIEDMKGYREVYLDYLERGRQEIEKTI